MSYFGKPTAISASYIWTGDRQVPRTLDQNYGNIHTFIPVGMNAYTTTTQSNPAVVGQVELVGTEFHTASVYLRNIVSTTSASASASIQLYNLTSGCYVQLGALGETTLSTSSPTPVILESIDLMYATNFNVSASSIYEVRMFTQTGSQSASLGSSVFIASQQQVGWTPYNYFGNDLLFWSRATPGDRTLSIVYDWQDQSPSGMVFSGSTEASWPSSSLGGVQFEGVNDYLDAGPTIMNLGAFTWAMDMKLNALPGVSDYYTNHVMRTGTSAWAANDSIGDPAYRTWTFRGGAGIANSVGVAETLDTSRHRKICTYNNGTVTDPTSYTAYIDGVSKTVLTSGPMGLIAGDNNSIGALSRAAGNLGYSKISIYAIVVYNSVLSAPNIAALDALMATGTATYAQYAALGTVKLCLLPAVAQSGRVSAWTNRSPDGVGFTTPGVPSTGMYYDRAHSSDGRPSIGIYDVNGVASRADITGIGGAAKITWCFWMRATTIVTTTNLILQYAVGDVSWIFHHDGVTGDITILTSTDGSEVTTHGTFPAAPSAWKHIAAVYDGTGATNADRLKLYVNGVAQTGTFGGTIPATLYNSSAPMAWGYTGTSDVGLIDDFFIVKRALTLAEINYARAAYTRSG